MINIIIYKSIHDQKTIIKNIQLDENQNFAQIRALLLTVSGYKKADIWLMSFEVGEKDNIKYYEPDYDKLFNSAGEQCLFKDIIKNTTHISFVIEVDPNAVPEIKWPNPEKTLVINPDHMNNDFIAQAIQKEKEAMTLRPPSQLSKELPSENKDEEYLIGSLEELQHFREYYQPGKVTRLYNTALPNFVIYVNQNIGDLLPSLKPSHNKIIVAVHNLNQNGDPRDSSALMLALDKLGVENDAVLHLHNIFADHELYSAILNRFITPQHELQVQVDKLACYQVSATTNTLLPRCSFKSFNFSFSEAPEFVDLAKYVDLTRDLHFSFTAYLRGEILRLPEFLETSIDIRNEKLFFESPALRHILRKQVTALKIHANVNISTEELEKLILERKNLLEIDLGIFLSAMIHNYIANRRMHVQNLRSISRLKQRRELEEETEKLPVKMAEVLELLATDNLDTNTIRNQNILIQISEWMLTIKKCYLLFGSLMEDDQLNKFYQWIETINLISKKCLKLHLHNSFRDIFPFTTKSIVRLLITSQQLLTYSEELNGALETSILPICHREMNGEISIDVIATHDETRRKCVQLSLPFSWALIGCQVYLHSLKVVSHEKHKRWINHATFDLIIQLNNFEGSQLVNFDVAVNLLKLLRESLLAKSSRPNVISGLDNYFRDLALVCSYYFITPQTDWNLFTQYGDTTVIRSNENLARLMGIFNCMNKIIGFALSCELHDDNFLENKKVMLKMVLTVLQYHVLPIIYHEHNESLFYRQFCAKPDELRQSLDEAKCNADELWGIIRKILVTNKPNLPFAKEPEYFSLLRALQKSLENIIELSHLPFIKSNADDSHASKTGVGYQSENLGVQFRKNIDTADIDRKYDCPDNNKQKSVAIPPVVNQLLPPQTVPNHDHEPDAEFNIEKEYAQKTKNSQAMRVRGIFATSNQSDFVAAAIGHNSASSDVAQNLFRTERNTADDLEVTAERSLDTYR